MMKLYRNLSNDYEKTMISKVSGAKGQGFNTSGHSRDT